MLLNNRDTQNQAQALIVSNLTKKFSFSVKNPKATWFKNLFWPEKREIIAVNNISFSLKPGERVAFIGPNGAGKSTTIKMLTGILFPSSGTINILGLDPTKDRKKLAYQIGTVFGQRSQLLPNLPLTDSFEFFGVMYDLPDADIKKRIIELSELFDLNSFMDQPVRKLSLGQRMRAEVAVSLIHQPKIILLDEPTIGLDVIAKKALRDLLLKINEEKGTTILLTSHDVGDIKSLCNRTIIINHGEIIKDIATEDLAKSFVLEKYISLVPNTKFTNFLKLPAGLKYDLKTANLIKVIVDINQISIKDSIKKLLDMFDIEDIDVYNVGLENVIRRIYDQEKN